MALIVMQWNARSIYRKLPELKQYLASVTALPNLLCIQETHLKPKYHPDFQNYTMLSKDPRPPEAKVVDY